MLWTEAEGTVTANSQEIRGEGGREGGGERGTKPTQAGEGAVSVSATAGVELPHSRDEVVVTEGQEVSLPVSPPVEQGGGLEVVRTELCLCWPGGDRGGDQLNISYRLHLQPHLPNLLPPLLLLLLPGLHDDDEPELAVVPGGVGHLVEVV